MHAARHCGHAGILLGAALCWQYGSVQGAHAGVFPCALELQFLCLFFASTVAKMLQLEGWVREAAKFVRTLWGHAEECIRQ